MQDLTRSAIQASLLGNWEEAIDFNTNILATEPENIAALNRLAHAYTKLDQKTSAKQVYEKVLNIDKYNPIALKRLKSLPNMVAHDNIPTVNEDFIEEPGKTRCVKLTKLASKDILLTLVCKEEVVLTPRSRLISINRMDKTYIGSLPDDLSIRLKRLIKSGYAYKACIKLASENQTTLFVREVKRPNRPTASPSFSPKLKLKQLRKRKRSRSKSK